MAEGHTPSGSTSKKRFFVASTQTGRQLEVGGAVLKALEARACEHLEAQHRFQAVERGQDRVDVVAQRLGIYRQDQVLDAADDLPLSCLRTMFEAKDETFVAPMSPRRLDEQFFLAICREASVDAR